MVDARWWVVAALVLLGGSCGAEVALAPAPGGSGAGGEGAGGEGGGAAGSVPGPLDACDVYDGDFGTDSKESCCQTEGCVWRGILEGTGCISADKLCYFDACTGEPTFEADCDPGFECILEWANNTTSDCNGGEACAAQRGYCLWAGK